jgi:hypothetical protein
MIDSFPENLKSQLEYAALLLESMNTNDPASLVDQLDMLDGMKTELSAQVSPCSILQWQIDILLFLCLNGFCERYEKQLMKAIDELFSLDPFSANCLISNAAVLSLMNKDEEAACFARMAAKLSSDPVILIDAAEVLSYHNSPEARSILELIVSRAESCLSQLSKRIQRIAHDVHSSPEEDPSPDKSEE